MIATVAPNDACTISRVLIDEFSSLSRIFVETPESVERVIGPNAMITELLHAAYSAYIESLRYDLPDRLLSSTDQKLIDYLVTSMGSRSQEILRVLFLNRSNNLIGDEILSVGSLHSIAVYPRSIFKRAFELSASAIMVVHNHPGGSIEPSAADVDFTRKLGVIGVQLEVEIKDHIIIAGTRWFSFLRRGLL